MGMREQNAGVKPSSGIATNKLPVIPVCIFILCTKWYGAVTFGTANNNNNSNPDQSIFDISFCHYFYGSINGKLMHIQAVYSAHTLTQKRKIFIIKPYVCVLYRNGTTKLSGFFLLPLLLFAITISHHIARRLPAMPSSHHL